MLLYEEWIEQAVRRRSAARSQRPPLTGEWGEGDTPRRWGGLLRSRTNWDHRKTTTEDIFGLEPNPSWTDYLWSNLLHSSVCVLLKKYGCKLRVLFTLFGLHASTDVRTLPKQEGPSLPSPPTPRTSYRLPTRLRLNTDSVYSISKNFLTRMRQTNREHSCNTAVWNALRTGRVIKRKKRTENLINYSTS